MLAPSEVAGPGPCGPNQVAYGSFRPVLRNVPTDTIFNRITTAPSSLWYAASTIISLDTKPLSRGTLEIDAAPIM